MEILCKKQYCNMFYFCNFKNAICRWERVGSILCRCLGRFLSGLKNFLKNILTFLNFLLLMLFR